MWRWAQKISMRGLCRGVPINRKRNNFGSACVHAMAPPSKLPAVNHAHGGNPCGVGSTRCLLLSYLTHVRATRGWLVRCNRTHRQFPSSSRLLHCAAIMERLGHHAVGEGATHASTGNCAGEALATVAQRAACQKTTPARARGARRCCAAQPP